MISLLDKTFEILAEGLALESSVSLIIMDKAVILRSRMERIMLLRFQMLHLGLTLDGFKDVLDRELQRGEAVIYSASSSGIC